MSKSRKIGSRTRSACRVTYERHSSSIVIYPTLISTPSFRRNKKLRMKKKLKIKTSNPQKRFVKKFLYEAGSNGKRRSTASFGRLYGAFVKHNSSSVPERLQVQPLPHKRP
ncbi:hypothetical protein BIW11_03855 [Tropilaelaps mercedesae]|uniref:Uncharacterized protein n=1 Tax=Tropilaelaps mercedesae TaxID=418985 RepID=A0A1V9XF56_9ACAR|nr:hypothetical protein BIW11_03855 [Tropilaelaps mercedesae]